MKANELRIGNFVSSKSENQQITSIGIAQCASLIKGCELSERHFDYDKITGIPLTENWLLQFGFEQNEKYFKIKTGWYFDVRGDKKQTKLLIKHTSADNFVVVSPANGSIYLEYVHQLQNLFFALTSGDELKIDL